MQVTGKVIVRLNGVEYGTKEPAELTVGGRNPAFRFVNEPGTWGCYDEAVVFFGEGSAIAEALKPPPLTLAEVRKFLGYGVYHGQECEEHSPCWAGVRMREVLSLKARTPEQWAVKFPLKVPA